jgi:hypothetical protein
MLSMLLMDAFGLLIPLSIGVAYPSAPQGAETLRPAEESLATLRGRWHARLAQASLPRWSSTTATWKSRCVSTPKITSSLVSGLSTEHVFQLPIRPVGPQPQVFQLPLQQIFLLPPQQIFQMPPQQIFRSG